MTGRDAEAPKSVFHTVDQNAVMSGFGDAGDDGVTSNFFSAALQTPGTQPSEAFAAGVAAFTGTEVAATSPAAESAKPSRLAGSPAPTVASPATTVVDYRGDLAADEAATTAFILHGPAGVRRIA